MWKYVLVVAIILMDLNVHSFGLHSRRLQFEGMFDNAQKVRRKKSTKDSIMTRRMNRPQALVKQVDDIILNMDRYHLWWTGPPETETFKPLGWGAQHNVSNNVIFTMAVIQGSGDKVSCSSPNDFKLFLGTARKVFHGDIVLAIESLTLTDDVKSILIENKVIVYELSHELCSKATQSIFCGSLDERVPASMFRYFYYEKWASIYLESSLIMLVDFRDILFQSNPFEYHLDDWFPEYQLAVFQEFHPNMVINRCRFNKRIMSECYGADTLRALGDRIIVSSGGALGSRSAVIAWSHHMTMQLQEAPGRMVETRCTSGGIDHSFINYLVYGNKLRSLMRIRVFPQGEGALNTLGGLMPNTVVANITGDLRHFWKILTDDGHVMNWNGEISPVVHQLDHFTDELTVMAREVLARPGAPVLQTGAEQLDLAWQAVHSSRCLWGCTTRAAPK